MDERGVREVGIVGVIIKSSVRMIRVYWYTEYGRLIVARTQGAKFL